MNGRPESPYKGLSAFDDSDLDALLFFGRERESEIVVANLIASRLTILYGPSGVGKSSLIRAAVARSLRELPEEPLVVVFSRWGEDPGTALAEAVGGAPGSTALSVLADAQADRDVYLILDQAEEYFLYHAEDAGRDSFAETLPAVLAEPLRVNVLVSLREDSLAKLDRFAGRIPRLFGNTLRLDRLDRQAARSAVIRPVERFAQLTGEDVTVEEDLVERVLDEVGTGRIEASPLGGQGTVESDAGSARIEAPFLQLVMQRLWEEERASGSSALRLETLSRLGGAEQIVEDHLASAMNELTSSQKDVAARLFNHLVTPSGTKIAHDVSDLADFGQVSVFEVEPVLQTLAERRILRAVDEGGATRYEIFHDVLAHPVLSWRGRHRTEREIEGKLDEARRRRSRVARLLALGLGALVVVGAVAVFALAQRSNANEQTRDAQARELDASAVALLQEDPELSLLLASESARTSPAPTAESALRQALLASKVRATFDAGGVVQHIAIAPSGSHVAYTSSNGRVAVRALDTGSEVLTAEVGAGAVVSFSPDSTAILVAGSDGPARLLDVETGDVRCVLGVDDAPAADATMAGAFGVVVRNGKGYVWSTESCRLVRTVESVGKASVRIVAAPGGRSVAFLSGSEALAVEIPSGRKLYVLEHDDEITSLAFSSDSAKVVTGGRDRVARVWDGLTGRKLLGLSGNQGQVLDVAVNSDGSEVASASTDGTARVWATETALPRGYLYGHTNFVNAVEFSADGQSVVTASLDRTARTWRSNGQLLAPLAGHGGTVVDAVFTPDGFTVVTGGEDGTVKVWDAGTRPDLMPTDLPAPEPPTTAATSPDGQATATATGRAIRLERANGSASDLIGHRLRVTSVSFSPDGKRLLSASRDHDVILWDVATGKQLRVLRGHFNTVSDARFSPDARWIATAGPRSVGLWRADDGDLVRLLFGPVGPFTAAAFLPDSRTIVASSAGHVESSYDCRVCGEIPELLAYADELLALTGRQLTPEERELYFD